MAFPTTRLRRLRRTAELRNMVAETRLTPDAFVYPMFVCPGEGVRKEVRSMPGVFNLSVDEAVKEAAAVHSLGVPAVILFGLPDKKDEVATGAWAENGIVQQATRAIKREVPELVLMGDVCLFHRLIHRQELEKVAERSTSLPLRTPFPRADKHRIGAKRHCNERTPRQPYCAIQRGRRKQRKMPQRGGKCHSHDLKSKIRMAHLRF